MGLHDGFPASAASGPGRISSSSRKDRPYPSSRKCRRTARASISSARWRNAICPRQRWKIPPLRRWRHILKETRSWRATATGFFDTDTHVGPDATILDPLSDARPTRSGWRLGAIQGAPAKRPRHLHKGPAANTRRLVLGDAWMTAPAGYMAGFTGVKRERAISPRCRSDPGRAHRRHGFRRGRRELDAAVGLVRHLDRRRRRRARNGDVPRLSTAGWPIIAAPYPERLGGVILAARATSRARSPRCAVRAGRAGPGACWSMRRTARRSTIPSLDPI